MIAKLQQLIVGIRLRQFSFGPGGVLDFPANEMDMLSPRKGALRKRETRKIENPGTRAGPGQFHASFRHPLDRLGLDVVGGTAAGILATAAREAADDADGHVVIAENLAAQPHARQPAGGQHLLLGQGHLIGLAGHELDAASCATSIAAAGMQLVHSRLVFEGQHEPLALRHLEFTDAVNG